MNSPAKTQGLNLGRLSQVAQMTVKTPTAKQAPDAEIELNRIYSKKQVRTKFNNLDDLASAIKLNGMIEPLVIHEESDGRFLLIVGERRFRAAPLAGLTKVPVVIKRGMSELEIRRMQVSENNDRENLTAYDQAMGVIEDVTKYGIDETRRIWNKPDKNNPGKEQQSEGWISKRMAVTTYTAPVFELLKNGICGDFEVLHSLNQLHTESEEEFGYMLSRLQEGTPISRVEVRNKVTAVKQFKREQAEFNIRREEARQAIQTQEQQKIKEPADTQPGNLHANVEHADNQHDTSQGGGQLAVNLEQAYLPTMGPTPQELAAAKRRQLEASLTSLRSELFEWGDANTAQFNNLKTKMIELDYGMNETEWVLWSGFLSMVLPMLAALGDNKGLAYLKRLQEEFKTKTPLLMWREQHPLESNADFLNDNDPRVEIPLMPDGWRF